MEYRPNLRHPLTEDEATWLKEHSKCSCDLSTSLFVYGASKVYDLRELKSSNKKPKSFFGDFIILFEDNTIEVWSASSIEALSELVKVN